MSELLFIWVLVVGIAGLAASVVDRATGRWIGKGIVVAAWAGVLVGLAGMSAGLLQSPLAAFSIVGLAAFVGFPVFSKVFRERNADVSGDLFRVAALLALAMAAVGWAVSGLNLAAAAVGWTVFAAQWAAVMAAVSTAVSASFAARFSLSSGEGAESEKAAEAQVISPALALVVAALVGSVLMIANMRASVPGQGYSLTLWGDAGRVVWTVAGSAVGERVVLQATSSLNWANGALAGLVAFVLALGVISVIRARLKIGEKQVAAGGIVLGLGIWGVLGSILQGATKVGLPSAQPYLDFSRQLYRVKGLSETIADRASFVMEGALTVRWYELLPEMVGLGLAGALCVLAGLRVLLKGKTHPDAERAQEELKAVQKLVPELGLQALGFGWLAWILAQFMRWGLYGTIGLAGAGEWVSLGILLLASGTLLAGWRADGNRVDRVLSAVAPGVIAALLILGVAVSYVFGTSFGQ